MKEMVIKYATLCWDFSKFYLMWILIHFITANAYSYFCAYKSITGLFISPFVAVAPHCRAMYWALGQSIDVINNMWIVFGSWLSMHFLNTRFLGTSSDGSEASTPFSNSASSNTSSENNDLAFDFRLASPKVRGRNLRRRRKISSSESSNGEN